MSKRYVNARRRHVRLCEEESMPRRSDFSDEPTTEHGWLLVNRGEALELRPTCSDEALIAEWALENCADDRELGAVRKQN